MSYSVYSAKGIVVARSIIGEANVLLRIATAEYGILSVMAQNGAASAKFAPACTLCAQGVYDIVRGKRIWRLIGVSDVLPLQLPAKNETIILFCRYIAAYTKRFVGNEEEPDSRIYELIVSALKSAQELKMINSNWLDAYRYRLLILLGYIDESDTPKSQIHIRELIQKGEEQANVGE